MITQILKTALEVLGDMNVISQLQRNSITSEAALLDLLQKEGWISVKERAEGFEPAVAFVAQEALQQVKTIPRDPALLAKQIRLDLAKKITKRNQLALKNLKPGNYSAKYKGSNSGIIKPGPVPPNQTHFTPPPGGFHVIP